MTTDMTQPAPNGTPAKTSVMAILSLVLGIVGLPLVGLILGTIALSKIKHSGGQLLGRGLAIAGIIISSVLMILQIFALLLASVAFLSFGTQVDKARVTATKAELSFLHGAVHMYKLDTGQYPSEEGGLLELVEAPEDIVGHRGPYLDQATVPLDAWGNEFIYILDPDDGKPFVIISYGADGEEGGEGDSADLWSTDL